LTVSAEDIVRLLETKHSQDLCVPQCKTGATWKSGKESPLMILDFWAMKKSWVKFNTCGYEIKVARSDFLNDDKWYGYTDYCHEFYFVCPPGVIYPEELPEDAGLIYTSRNCKRLFTKRKAPRREIVIPESIFRYILICRSRIVSGPDCYRQDNLGFWKHWLEEKSLSMAVGRGVSESLAKLIDKEVSDVRIENSVLRAQNRTLEDVKKILEDLGISCQDDYWSFKYKMKHALGSISGDQELLRRLFLVSERKTMSQQTSRVVYYVKCENPLCHYTMAGLRQDISPRLCRICSSAYSMGVDAGKAASEAERFTVMVTYKAVPEFVKAYSSFELAEQELVEHLKSAHRFGAYDDEPEDWREWVAMDPHIAADIVEGVLPTVSDLNRKESG